MKLSEGNIIEDLKRWYSAYLESISALSYSNNTIELYSRAIETFLEYSTPYQDEMRLIDIKSNYIAGYLAFLEENAKNRGNVFKNGAYLSKSTKQTYLKAIRNLFSFISDNNDELVTFDRYFKNLKIADSSKSEEKISYLYEEEIERLLTLLEREKQKGGYQAFRNALLVKLMLYGGLRISEALQFSWGALEEIEGGLYAIGLYGKGGKPQKGFIAQGVIQEELDYFQREAKLSPSDPVMVTQGGKRVNRVNAYQMINRIYQRAGIKKRGLHLLRHTLAMRLTKQGVNPLVIQKILRHSNLATTTIYAKATSESVAKAMGEWG